MIKVYQIRLNDSDMIQLRAEGWESTNPKIQAYGKRSFIEPQDVDMQFYDHVANVLTYDREDAFRLMNLWEQPDLVQVIDREVCSMSVGDIVEMDNGTRYLCASFGFKEI